MRELRPGLAQRLARRAPLRYKAAGAGAAIAAYCVYVPLVSVLVDPDGSSVAAVLVIVVASSAVLVWSYYVSTALFARRPVRR